MRLLYACLLAALLVPAADARAQAADRAPDVVPRQVSGLSPEEADALVARLEEAQRALRARKFQPFELLAGSLASYDATRLPPREAFLRVRFRRVWKIELIPTGSRYRKSYRLAYAPDGLGRLYWDIEVTTGADDRLERVLMSYKPPAPF